MLDTGYWMLENGVMRAAQAIPQRQHAHRVSLFYIYKIDRIPYKSSNKDPVSSILVDGW